MALVEIAPGELIDKITILQIKSERISDSQKVGNVQRELDVLKWALSGTIPDSDHISELMAGLKLVNEALWDIENDIRDCERNQEFGSRFIELARSVYKTNDKRAAIKKEINRLCGSDIVEEKSYQPY